MTSKTLLTVRLIAAAAMTGLSGCVGAPVYQPAYAPAYAAPPGYAAAPGYEQPPQQQPPQQGYSPSAQPAQAYAATCYAGVYTCALAQSLPLGAPCSCPGLGAPSYGNVR